MTCEVVSTREKPAVWSRCLPQRSPNDARRSVPCSGWTGNSTVRRSARRAQLSSKPGEFGWLLQFWMHVNEAGFYSYWQLECQAVIPRVTDSAGDFSTAYPRLSWVLQPTFSALIPVFTLFSGKHLGLNKAANGCVILLGWLQRPKGRWPD